MNRLVVFLGCSLFLLILVFLSQVPADEPRPPLIGPPSAPRVYSPPAPKPPPSAKAAPVKEEVSFKVNKRKAACECGCEAGAACTCVECPHGASCPGWNYYSAYTAAVHSGKPLIVFVGQPAKEMEGCVVCRSADFPDVEGPGVVVSRPNGSKLIRVGDLSGYPTAYHIQAVLQQSVSGPPVPQRPTVQFPRQFAPVFSPGGSGRRSGGC